MGIEVNKSRAYILIGFICFHTSRLIKETVGACGIPRVGWQIDPFGHSREQASIFSQLGYDGVFFARLDHDDKDTRQKAKSLNFAWQTSANLRKNNYSATYFNLYRNIFLQQIKLFLEGFFQLQSTILQMDFAGTMLVQTIQ